RTLSGFRTDARNHAASGTPPSASFLLRRRPSFCRSRKGTSTMTVNTMDMSAPVTRGELRAELQQVDTKLGALLARIETGEQRLIARIESGEQQLSQRLEGVEQRM